MGFFSTFRSQVPNIIARLESIRKDLDVAQNNIKQLELLEKELSSKETSMAQCETITKKAVEDFGVALWVKNCESHFLFTNKACRETILKCEGEKDPLELTNGDFAKDALAQVCLQSDKKTMESQTTKRFIEHAIYEKTGHVFLDVVKSPFYDEKGKLAGTVGSGIDMTNSIPDKIKEQHINASSIEIPVDVTMSERIFVDLLERRQTPRG